jgi:hypothetical protein
MTTTATSPVATSPVFADGARASARGERAERLIRPSRPQIPSGASASGSPNPAPHHTLNPWAGVVVSRLRRAALARSETA